VKEKFLEYWDKEIKRLDQKIDEGFIIENKVVYNRNVDLTRNGEKAHNNNRR